MAFDIANAVPVVPEDQTGTPSVKPKFNLENAVPADTPIEARTGEQSPQTKQSDRTVFTHDLGIPTSVLDFGVPGSGMSFHTALGIAEQPGAGLYAIGVQAAAGVGAGALTAAKYAGAGIQDVAKHVGVALDINEYPIGSPIKVFEDVYNTTAEGMSSHYVPLTPRGKQVTDTLGKVIGKGLDVLGDIGEAGIFTLNWGQTIEHQLTGKRFESMGIDLNALSGSIAKAAGMLFLLRGGTDLKPVIDSMPRQKGGAAAAAEDINIRPLNAAEIFASKYKAVSDAIDASKVGSLKPKPQGGAMETAYQAMNRQLDEQLGLDKNPDQSWKDKPITTKMKMVIEQLGGTEIPVSDKNMLANYYADMAKQLHEADVAQRQSNPKLPPPYVLDEPLVVDTKGNVMSKEQQAIMEDSIRRMTPSQRAEMLGIGPMGELFKGSQELSAARAKAIETGAKADEKLVRQAENALKSKWNNIFDYPKDTAKRAAALEAYIKANGNMSYNQALIMVGDRVLGRKIRSVKNQRGAIDFSEFDINANVEALKHLGEDAKQYAAAGLLARPGWEGTKELYRATHEGQSTALSHGAWVTDSPDIAKMYAEGTSGNAKGVVTSHMVDAKNVAKAHGQAYLVLEPGKPIDHIMRYREGETGTPVTFGELIANKPPQPIVSATQPRSSPRMYQPGYEFEKSITAADGKPYTLRLEHVNAGEGKHGAVKVTLQDGAGNVVGGAIATPRQPFDSLSSSGTIIKNIALDESVQKQGLAKEIYKTFAELGTDVEKTNGLTGPGQALWNSMEKAGIAKGGVVKSTLKVKPRQGGAIDFSGMEQNIPAAKQAAKDIVDKAWIVPNPNATAELVAERFKQVQADNEKGRKIISVANAKALRRAIVSPDYDLMKSLEKAGGYGEEARLRRVVQDGATMAGISKSKKIFQVIFDDLSSQEKAIVDIIARARRIIQIDKYKGVGSVKHAEGTGPEMQVFLDKMHTQLGAKTYDTLNERASAVFQAERGILKRLLDEGIIDQETYDRMKNFDYIRQDYLDIVDPSIPITSKVRQMPESIRGSGIPFLEHGKAQSVRLDSKALLYEDIIRSEGVIARNKTLQALHNLALDNPENGIVRLPSKDMTTTVKKGYRIGDEEMRHTPDGWTSLGVRIGGKQRNVLMTNDYAAQFISKTQVLDTVVLSFKDMPITLATIARVVSGSALRRATSTVYEPSFVLAGLPMDILHLWFASDTYSPWAPIYLGQLARDMAVVASDVIKRKGRWEDAMNEGISGAYLAHNSRSLITNASTGVAVESQATKVKTALAAVGDTQDTWIRIAHRERMIREGKPSWEATALANDRLNYSRSGAVIKAIDTVEPYTAIGVNATSRVIEQAYKGKEGVIPNTDTLIKVANLVAIVSAYKLASMMTSPETDKGISTMDKARNILNITFGDQLYIHDPDGSKRYLYATIRADQAVSPIIAAVIAGLEKATYGTMPDSIMSKTMGLVAPMTGMPPLFEAISTYSANYDFYRDSPIYQGPKIKPEDQVRSFAHGQPTSQIAQVAGQALGMSPMGLEAAASKIINTNNWYLEAMGSIWKHTLGGNNERDGAKETLQLIQEIPGFYRVIKFTNPVSDNMRASMKDAEETVGSKHYKATQGLDEMLFRYHHGQGVTISDVNTYINNHPQEMRKSLEEHAKFGIAVEKVFSTFKASEDVPAKAWWLHTAKMPAEARAQIYYNAWLSLDSSDRQRMDNISTNLDQLKTGYRSDAFITELQKQKSLLGLDRR